MTFRVILSYLFFLFVLAACTVIIGTNKNVTVDKDIDAGTTSVNRASSSSSNNHT